jgi:hypothetical protein
MVCHFILVDDGMSLTGLAEAQVPTRATVKSFSAQLVERELKKTKRKQKKQHSDDRDKRTPPPTSRNYSPSPTARPTTRASSPISSRHK